MLLSLLASIICCVVLVSCMGFFIGVKIFCGNILSQSNFIVLALQDLENILGTLRGEVTCISQGQTLNPSENVTFFQCIYQFCQIYFHFLLFKSVTRNGSKTESEWGHIGKWYCRNRIFP